MRTNWTAKATVVLFAFLLSPAFGRSSYHSSKSSSKTYSSSHTGISTHKGGTDSGSHSYGAVAKSKKSESHLAKHTSPVKCSSCARDSHGKIQRSSTAKHDFQRSKVARDT